MGTGPPSEFFSSWGSVQTPTDGTRDDIHPLNLPVELEKLACISDVPHSLKSWLCQWKQRLQMNTDPN